MTRSFDAVKRSLSAGFCALSIGIVLKDKFYSLHRVSGSSMEPTLKDGDVVLVRKFDVFPCGSNYDDSLLPSPPTMSEDNQYTKEVALISYHLWHMHQIDKMYDRSNNAFSFRSWWKTDTSFVVLSTINPIPGSVIIFASPVDFPIKLCMKRVLAQEGQRCRPISMGNNRYSSIIHVPENTIWVEGDNRKDSQDSSTTYGAISKKLIVGVVDRIIWPPSRIGEVHRINPPFYRSWW
jgi:signal peptidase I